MGAGGGGGAASSAPLVCSLTGHLGFVASVAACPSRAGLVASGAADRAVKVWDTRKRECLHSFEGHAGCVTGVAWAPEGSAGAAAGSVRLASVSDAGGLALHTVVAAGPS